MEQIIIFEKVRIQLRNISKKLHSKKYFGTLALADAYVLTLINFINAIPTVPHKRTKNQKYGAYYCTYKHSNKTSWYIIFDKKGDLYNIKNIINNHTKDYPTYISGV